MKRLLLACLLINCTPTIAGLTEKQKFLIYSYAGFSAALQLANISACIIHSSVDNEWEKNCSYRIPDSVFLFTFGVLALAEFCVRKCKKDSYDETG